MQDFQRALIVGSNTFGKGSVQTVIPLSDGTALRLTVAKYYLPSGRPINRSDEKQALNGITPDVEVKVPIETEIKLYGQSEMIFAKDAAPKSSTEEKDKVADEALNKALEIIKEGRVFDAIKESKVLDKEKERIVKENKEKKK
jgi:carboxyl-terminal processing protease